MSSLLREGPTKVERVAVCPDCPNRISRESGKRPSVSGRPDSVVGFHDSGVITYVRSPGAGCGADLVKAHGKPADILRTSIERCRQPEVTIPRNPSIIERIVSFVRGTQAVEPVVDCPAALAHFDDHSPRQVIEFFEGA